MTRWIIAAVLAAMTVNVALVGVGGAQVLADRLLRARRPQVDRCPMGGVHDPGDSDRPCPRCGASPR